LDGGLRARQEHTQAWSGDKRWGGRPGSEKWKWTAGAIFVEGDGDADCRLPNPHLGNRANDASPQSAAHDALQELVMGDAICGWQRAGQPAH